MASNGQQTNGSNLEYANGSTSWAPLIEKAQSTYDEEQSAELERKFREADFDLNDFLNQMRQVRKMGPLQNLLGMVPGISKEMKGMKIDEREFDRVQAIILSMTPAERRRSRGAAGCGSRKGRERVSRR